MPIKPKRSNKGQTHSERFLADAMRAFGDSVYRLALGRVGQSQAPFDFSVQAYGASQDTILSMGSDGTIVFDIDSNFMAPPDSQYAQLGVYTGCLFRIEGEDIVRIQANVDRGELYRFSSEEFVKSSDPELWEEAVTWKQTKIGEDGPFAPYDMVQPTSGNDGKDRSDPDKLVGFKAYQRMGKTVDVPVSDSDGSRLTDYCFGLWTNEDRSGSDYQGDFGSYIDTLDGAKLTITVEKSDGSCSTKVIELRSADVRAHIGPEGDQEGASSLQLEPKIVDPSSESEETLQDDPSEAMTVHTLYGTVVEQNSDPFPCGAASYPTLDKPLTEPSALGTATRSE